MHWDWDQVDFWAKMKLTRLRRDCMAVVNTLQVIGWVLLVESIVDLTVSTPILLCTGKCASDQGGWQSGWGTDSFIPSEIRRESEGQKIEKRVGLAKYTKLPFQFTVTALISKNSQHCMVSVSLYSFIQLEPKDCCTTVFIVLLLFYFHSEVYHLYSECNNMHSLITTILTL